MQPAQIAEPGVPPNGTVLDAVESYIRSELKTRLGSFLDRAEHALDEAWRQSSNPADWSAGREAAAWLSRHKQAIQGVMYERMVVGLSGRTQGRSADMADLRLMNIEELTVTLARAKMVSRVMERGKATVRELEARLETLSAARIRVNPKALGPGQLVDCFQGILQEYAVPPPAQSVLMGAFGDRSAEQIIEFYAGLNALLHRLGVRTTFFNAGATTSGEAGQPETAGRMSAAGWKPGQLRAQVLYRLQAAGGRTDASPLSPRQLRRIEHLEAFFLEIMRDERISERIRSELGRLILPLMAARLPEPDSFGNPDSPVRVFVRQLALLGYRDQEAPLEDFDLIQALIGRIVAEGGEVVDSFHGGAEALYTLARRQIRKLRGQRMQGGADNTPARRSLSERLPLAEEARKQVILELREHAAGMTLPLPVQEFILRLLGPWMIVRFQRYGEGSQPWAEARAFAALFFDALRLAVDEKEQTRKQALRRQTLVQARVRTQRSRAPAKKAAELLSWLEVHFTELDRQRYPAAASDAVPTSLVFLEALPVLQVSGDARPA